jgi:hypothetical protein
MLASTQPEDPAMVENPGFEQQIKPLFRDKDRQSMLSRFDLWSYDSVGAHADGIARQLRSGTMPCDGAWPESDVDLFQRWVDTGKLP